MSTSFSQRWLRELALEGMNDEKSRHYATKYFPYASYAVRQPAVVISPRHLDSAEFMMPAT